MTILSDNHPFEKRVQELESAALRLQIKLNFTRYGVTLTDEETGLEYKITENPSQFPRFTSEERLAPIAY